MKPITNTGDEKKVLKQLRKLRRSIDSIGGTTKADNLRRDLDDLIRHAIVRLTHEIT
jgi:hypothetical protein